jgi:aspartate racemase
MRTLGILGGVGPETTAKVYLSIINLIKKSGKAKYPSIIIYNLPFPLSIEREAIIEGKNSENMIPYLVDGAKTLEKAGASFCILPCNTLHKYTEEIRKSINIPFLSIIEETTSVLKNKSRVVGILGSETTVRDKIYEESFEKAGLEILYPNKGEQETINNIIIEILNGEKNKSSISKIETICQSLKNSGADNILLACTDLQEIKEINSPIPITDTTDILIQASLKELTK